MKKLALLLSLVMVLTMFVGCGKKAGIPDETRAQMEADGFPTELIPENITPRYAEHSVYFDTAKYSFAEIKDFYENLMSSWNATELIQYDAEEMAQYGLADANLVENGFDAWLYNGTYEGDEEMNIYITLNESEVYTNRVVIASLNLVSTRELNEMMGIDPNEEHSHDELEVTPEATQEVTTEDGTVVNEMVLDDAADTEVPSENPEADTAESEEKPAA